MHDVLLHFGEIGIKGKNKYTFIQELVISIKKLVRKHNIGETKIKVLRDRIKLTINDSKENIDLMLSHLYGIANYYYIQTCNSDIDSILNIATKLIEEAKKDGIKSLSITTKRSDKKFPFESPQINQQIGEIMNSKGIKVDYKNGDETLFVKITKKESYLSLKRYQGLGGLPVNSTGKALCLLSGGIDSPVAANLMMKRGVHVDYLHFHALASNELVEQSKIKKTIEQLNNFQGKAKLYTLPTNVFEMYAGKIRYSNYEVILFKHFILKYAEKLAYDLGYDALITGDNLAQVASQTMKNLTTTSYGIKIPILRPLIAYDKEEIIQKAHSIKTYKLAIQEYKDCCSLLAKKPTTVSKYEKLKIILEDINFNEILEQSRREMSEISTF